MHSVLERVERVFREAFGEGPVQVPRRLGVRTDSTVRLKGTKVLVQAARNHDKLKTPKETGGG